MAPYRACGALSPGVFRLVRPQQELKHRHTENAPDQQLETDTKQKHDRVRVQAPLDQAKATTGHHVAVTDVDQQLA